MVGNQMFYYLLFPVGTNDHSLFFPRTIFSLEAPGGPEAFSHIAPLSLGPSRIAELILTFFLPSVF